MPEYTKPIENSDKTNKSLPGNNENGIENNQKKDDLLESQIINCLNEKLENKDKKIQKMEKYYHEKGKSYS